MLTGKELCFEKTMIARTSINIQQLTWNNITTHLKLHQQNCDNLISCTVAIFTYKSNSITGLERPWGFQEADAPRCPDNGHMKVVRLSALCTSRLYPQEIFLALISIRGCQPQGHSEARGIMSMKNSNDTIGNPTRDLPTCSVVPQPTAPDPCWCVCSEPVRFRTDIHQLGPDNICSHTTKLTTTVYFNGLFYWL
jgi:hypothetical protein